MLIREVNGVFRWGFMELLVSRFCFDDMCVCVCVYVVAHRVDANEIMLGFDGRVSGGVEIESNLCELGFHKRKKN